MITVLSSTLSVWSDAAEAPHAGKQVKPGTCTEMCVRNREQGFRTGRGNLSVYGPQGILVYGGSGTLHATAKKTCSVIEKQQSGN